MPKKADFYALIATALATVASALIYVRAKSYLAAFINIGESAPGQDRRVMNAVNFSRALFLVMSLITVVLFARFIALKQNAARKVPEKPGT